jgi:hypothetical protein
MDWQGIFIRGVVSGAVQGVLMGSIIIAVLWFMDRRRNRPKR